MNEPGEKFDYIVVGAGSAGCVLANRLSADPANRVLLIEAGGRDWYPWIHIPVGYFKTMHNPMTDWCYRTEPDAGLNGRTLQWPRGRVLGGSSSINGLLYIRGQHQDYDQWRQMGNAGWGWEDVLPYFRRSESNERGGDEFHGKDGLLSVSDKRMERQICDAVIDGAEQMGIPRNDDFNGAEQEGAGYFQFTTRNGRRCSTAVAFLNPARSRPNLEIRTHCMVHKLLVEDGRAAGIRYARKGRVEDVRCRGEIVLSAGAIGSPQILMLSGVGPAGHLKGMGIDVVRDLPGVGENLQDHLQLRMVFKTTLPNTLNDELRNPLRKMLMGLEYALFRTGPLTLAASQVCIFARTDPSLETPDIQYHIQPLSADSPGEGTHPFSAITVSVCQLRPESRGRILLKSAAPDVHPALHPEYLSAPADRRVAVAALKHARRLTETPALKPHIKEEFRPGAEARTDEEILAAARNIAQTIYHPVGTCKMGVDPQAVVDPRLRLHGIRGLRVADASIMPTITSGNTNAPAIMIGEKAADMMLEDAKAG